MFIIIFLKYLNINDLVLVSIVFAYQIINNDKNQRVEHSLNTNGGPYIVIHTQVILVKYIYKYNNFNHIILLLLKY
jgi:hypothetical protein